MTRERAREIALNVCSNSMPIGPKIVQEGIAEAIVSACELEAAAVREECAQFVQSLYGIAGMELAGKIRSLGPASALDEFERKAREDEAKWWEDFGIRKSRWHDHIYEGLYGQCRHSTNNGCERFYRLAALKPPASSQEGLKRG